MRFVVLGTSEFTIRYATALLDSGCEVCALISMPSSVRPLNSADIMGFAERNRIPYHEVEDINSSESVSLLQGYSSDYIFSSWPKILRKETLEISRIYCIGSHPTELPFNRGRHPLHWLIALGISESKLSFFRMDEGVDTGRVLLQIPFQITPDDLIGDVVSKVNESAYEGTRILCKKLLDNPFYSGTEQDYALANYWRKRTPHDVTLDLRMSSSMILRTVRSFAPPYPCANLIFGKHVLKIISASMVPMKMSSEELQRVEPGRIISIDGNRIRIKAVDGIVDLECEGDLPPELLVAKYIHPPSKYLIKWSEELKHELLGS